MKTVIYIFLLNIICVFTCLCENISISDSLYKLQKIQTGKERVWTLLKLGTELSRYKPDSAIVLLNQGIIEAQRNNYNLGIVDCYMKISFALICKSEYNQSIEYSYKALNTLEYKDEKKSVADIYNNLGLAFRDLGRIDSALIYLNKALLLYQSINDETGKFKTYNNLCNTYKDLNDFAVALDYLHKAEIICEKQQDKFFLYIIIMNFADTYNNLRLYEKSNEYYDKAYRIATEIGLSRLLCDILNNKGDNYVQLKEYDKAKDALFESLKIANELKYTFMIAMINLNLANAYLDDGNLTDAENYFHKSISVSSSINDYYGIALTQKNLAIVYIKEKKFKLAFQYLAKAMDYFESQKIYDDIKDIYLMKSEVYSEMGDYKKSSEYYHNYVALRDTLDNKDRRGIASAVLNKINAEKEIEKLSKENENIAESNTKQKYIIFGLLGTLLFSFAIFFVIYSKNKVIKKSRNDYRISVGKIEQIHDIVTNGLTNSLVPMVSYMSVKERTEDISQLEASFNEISKNLINLTDLIINRRAK
jgi:tetratricopeptide (TPR) repeat protein